MLKLLYLNPKICIQATPYARPSPVIAGISGVHSNFIWRLDLGHKKNQRNTVTFPLQCSHDAASPDGAASALRRRLRAGQWELFIFFLRERSLYYAFRLISCQPRLGTRPCWLGKLQAVTACPPTNLFQCRNHHVRLYYYSIGWNNHT